MRRAVLHLARLRGLVTSRTDMLLLVRMLGWWSALPLLKRLVPIERLVAFARLEATTSSRDREREARVASLAEWLFKLRPHSARDNCLERSLVAYRYLGELDAGPELVVGLGTDEDEVVGHVWVTVDGEPLFDRPQSLDAYESLVVFGTDGQPVRTAPANRGSG